MKVLILAFALVAVALAKPGFLNGVVTPGAVVAPLAYARLVPGAPIGPDGRVVDTPEVAVAKAAHTAAHINEKVSLANEAVRSADLVAYSTPGFVSAYVYPNLVAGAPIGADGRVVDTPEVAVAKVAHAAAHVNEKLTLVNEAARNYAAYATPVVAGVAGVYPAGVAGLAYSNVVY